MSINLTDPEKRRRRSTNPGQLTDREYEVVRLIARGHTNQEIADQLYLSINSVKTYIRLAYRRMGVTRRTQAIVWAFVHETAEGELARTAD